MRNDQRGMSSNNMLDNDNVEQILDDDYNENLQEEVKLDNPVA
jgi:hypothetical protein